MSNTLARVTAFAYDPPDIPDAVLDYAATLLLDTLGVAAGAVPMQAGQIDGFWRCAANDGQFCRNVPFLQRP